MNEVDRLTVLYEVNDAQFKAGMARMKAAGEAANAAIINGATGAEKAVSGVGSATKTAADEITTSSSKVTKTKKQETDAFEDWGLKVKQTNDQVSKSTDGLGDELSRLRAKYDPLYAASKRYEAELEELNRAFKLGALNAKQHEAAMDRLATTYLRSGTAMATTGKRASLLGGNLQNVGYQVGDFATQVGAGTSWTIALGQQLPQLIGGFGALGAVLGAVVAIGVPLGASLFNMGEKSKSASEQVDDLRNAIADYQQAAADASLPTSELAEKYGLAADKAREFLDILQQTTRINAATALSASASAIAETFSDLESRVARYNQVISQGFGENDSAALRQVKKIREEYGLTIPQAQELVDLLKDRETATSLEEQATAIQNIAAWLGNAAEATNYQNDALNEGAKAASEAALSALELMETTQDAERAAVDLSNAIGGISFADAINGANALSGKISSMIGQARTLMSAIGQAQSANLAAEDRRELVERERDLVKAGADRVKIEGELAALRKQQELDAAGVNIPAIRNQLVDDARATAEATAAAQAEIAEYNKAVAEASKASSGGGSKRKSSGSSRGKQETSLFADIDSDLEQLQRQIDLVGKSSQEVATLKAQWALLDEAKKRGIPVNEELNAQIAAQAGEVGRLTAELEAAEIAQDRFDEAIDGIASAMSNALIAGESLREGLAQVFAGIAADLLNSGIRNMLSNLIPQAGGGGGSFLGSLFGGFRASGGSVSSSKAYVVGENGPELFAPGVSGTVLNAAQVERAMGSTSGNGPNITINNNAPGVQVQTEYATKDEVRLIVTQGISASNRAASDRKYLRGGK